MAAEDGTPRLGYWKIRGLAQPIRMLLCYLNVDHEDVKYEVHERDNGTWDRSEWREVKQQMLEEGVLDYPNLPYFCSDEVNLSQSNAILSYVAERYGLYDDFTVQEKGQAAMHLEQVADVKRPGGRVFYSNSFDGQVETYKEKCKMRFQNMSRKLGAEKFLMGEKLCAADFALAEGVYVHRLLDVNIFAEMPNLVLYQQRVFSLPGVRGAPQDLACNNKMAKWGNEYLEPPISGGDKWIQLGSWRLGVYDEEHFSICHSSGNTCVIYKSDGSWHKGPRETHSLFESEFGRAGEPTNVVFGETYLEFGGQWRLGISDEEKNHLSISHCDGQTCMIWRSDGTRHGGPREDHSTWDDRVAENPCKFGAERDFIELGGEFRIGNVDGRHMSIGHNGLQKTCAIYRHDGTIHGGPREDFGLWEKELRGEN